MLYGFEPNSFAANLGGAAALVVLAAALAGCAPLVWTKPGGTQSEFAEDKYVCLQESQQRQGRAQVNRFGGAAIDTVETNSGLFGACMNARGWYLGQQSTSNASGSLWNQPGWTPPTGIGVPTAEEAQRKAEADRPRAADQSEFKLTVARSRLSLICYDTISYGPLWKKGACKPEAITPAQLGDHSTATPEEIRMMRGYVMEMNTNAALVAEADRASGNTFAARAVEAARDAVVVPAAGLIDGSMTWSAYNKARTRVR
ncbi:hypothetical protein LJR084_004840 [Variovorax sp. LjRoot84]|uniref:hypothetical protein n=1 Tax=Variovorax sp. LjRoot84 TaxID=3342340 RepID=UPI003ECC7E60